VTPRTVPNPFRRSNEYSATLRVTSPMYSSIVERAQSKVLELLAQCERRYHSATNPKIRKIRPQLQPGLMLLTRCCSGRFPEWQLLW